MLVIVLFLILVFSIVLILLLILNAILSDYFRRLHKTNSTCWAMTIRGVLL